MKFIYFWFILPTENLKHFYHAVLMMKMATGEIFRVIIV
jgi:hypothetical protein